MDQQVAKGAIEWGGSCLIVGANFSLPLVLQLYYTTEHNINITL